MEAILEEQSLRTPLASHRRNAVASVKVRHYVRGASAPFFVALFCVLLEHCPSRHFFGSATVASRTLSAFLDVLVLALFLRVYSAKVLFDWHRILSHVFMLPLSAPSTARTIGSLEGSYNPVNSVAEPHKILIQQTIAKTSARMKPTPTARRKLPVVAKFPCVPLAEAGSSGSSSDQ